MNYRPNYVSLGLFTPRGVAASWRTKVPTPPSAAASAMENEGGLVAKDAAAPADGKAR